MTLDVDDHLLPRLRPGQLRETFRPDAVQLPVVPRGPDEPRHRMGWFEFWKLTGSQPLSNNMVNGYNPNGLNVITSGITMSRPPRANFSVLYTIIDTGPIRTSALNTSISTGSARSGMVRSQLLRLRQRGGPGHDVHVHPDRGRLPDHAGASVDPQRMSYQFAVQIPPRMTPAFRMGSNSALNSFDTRFAPVSERR